MLCMPHTQIKKAVAGGSAAKDAEKKATTGLDAMLEAIQGAKKVQTGCIAHCCCRLVIVSRQHRAAGEVDLGSTGSDLDGGTIH